MGFDRLEDGPDPHDVQGHLKKLECSVRESLKSQVSDFELGITQGDLRVDLVMDPASGRVRLGIRQYYHKDPNNPGGETKKGCFVELNMNDLPDLKPGSELTSFIPEKMECRNCPVDRDKIPF